MTIEYDPAMGVLQIFFSWRGTVLQQVATEPLFWIVLLLHGAFWGIDYAIRLDCQGRGGVCPAPGQNLPEINWSAVTLTSSLFAFFLIFYQSQCYSRFYALYGHCVALGGGLMEWSSLVRQHMPYNPDVQWNCVRFMLAALNVEYYGLRDAGVDDDEWKIIKDRGLLTQREVDRLKAYDGFKPFLPVYWALGECKEHLWTPGKTSQANVLRMQMLEDKALKFRGHTSQIINHLKQPVPFPYFHVLNLMLVVALVTIAYALVKEGHIGMTFVVLSVYMVCVLGLKSVAVQLADPFGTDEVDFDLETFMKGAQKNALALCMDGFVPWGRQLPNELTNPLDGGAVVEPHRPKSMDATKSFGTSKSMGKRRIVQPPKVSPERTSEFSAPLEEHATGGQKLLNDHL
ncbi:hypothetical protein AB1Y20_007344 [Prymnesium parvum]|uniref:Bestrophin homolog n=1 Tax=Prymnesium parvum TaxID=97485 RepID=A0AB34IUJ2_PRYPA